MNTLSRLLAGIPLFTVLASFAIGGIGGLLALWMGLPLAMLLGSMLATALAGGLGMRVSGHGIAVPQKWRFVFVPIIGVAIGASFPEDFVAQAMNWWITMVALVLFVPGVHLMGFSLFRRLGGIDAPTAFFAAMPGGFIESLEMGEEAGADVAMLLMLQFLRLILCIVMIPIGFSLLEGHAVGSASGLVLGDTTTQLSFQDVLVMCAAGAVGLLVAKRLDLPAAILSGPLLAAGIAHALGLFHGAPPNWAILVTQWIMGSSMGCRLAGFTRQKAARAVWLSVVNVSAMLTVALGIAVALSPLVGEPVSAVVLAFAPGGVTEMSLVALSLQLSAVYVSLHHIARIILAVIMARILRRHAIG